MIFCCEGAIFASLGAIFASKRNLHQYFLQSLMESISTDQYRSHTYGQNHNGEGDVKGQKKRRYERQRLLPKIHCECGGVYQSTDQSKSGHRKTKIHQDYISSSSSSSSSISPL